LAIFQELPGLGALNSLLYMSDTIDNGVSNMQKNLAHRWKKSDFLQAQLPKAKLFKVSWEFENSAGEPFVVKGYGAASGFRGSKIMNKRPKLALLDDLISDAMSESDTEMRKVENVIKRGIQPALNPRQQRIIWAGTPFNERDPLCKAVVSGAWLTFMFPVCEQFPCTRKEFVGAWEDRFTFDHVKRQYDIAVAGGDTTEFYRELMLETTSDADKLIDTDKEIQWYPPEIVDFYHGEKTYIITSDLSFAGTSTSDDVIMDVWELRPNEDIYWVDGIHDQIGIDVTIDILFALVEQYRVISVGIEISGQQIAMIKLLEREMLKKNIFFELANERGRSKEQKGIRPVTNKLIRFKTVVPLFKRRKIFFPLRRKGDELMSAKVHQLDSVTRNGIRSRKDDALDSISMLGLMEINYPGERPETNSHKPQELDPHIWGKNILEAEDDYLDTYLV
jgi:predicted phage terminase large subunit-like protein